MRFLLGALFFALLMGVVAVQQSVSIPDLQQAFPGKSVDIALASGLPQVRGATLK